MMIKYIKDHKVNLLIQILFLIVLGFILESLQLDRFAVIYTICIGVLCQIIVAAYDYLRKRKFYKELEEYFSSLDKKYFLFEMIQEPSFEEGKIFYRWMEEICKSANDHLLLYKKEAVEYREYIEMWIHEVKTPVAAMRLMAENHPDERMRQIEEELNKIEYYLDQALYYARSSGVEKDYMVKELNLKKIVEKVIRSNARMLIKSKIKITMENMDQIVYSDEKWIEFILKQLLINAVKYRKETEPSIEFCAEKRNDRILLEVKDNGIGISAKDLPKVMEKGYTGTTGRKYAKSTGMGLYLCRSLSKKLGLSFQILSEEGKGTVVQIGFPRNSMTFLKKEE